MAIEPPEVIRSYLASNSPCDAETSAQILDLDDLLFFETKCKDKNDAEEPLYYYCTPNEKLTLPHQYGCPVCPNCKSSRIGLHEYLCRDIQDLPVRDHPTYLRVLFRSYCCNGNILPERCQIFRPKLKCLGKNGRITSRFFQRLQQVVYDKKTFSQIASDYHTSVSYVKQAFNAAKNAHKKNDLIKAFPHMAIDETYVHNRDKRTLYVELIGTSLKPSEQSEPKLCALNEIPRSTDSIKKNLLVKLDHPEVVKVVTMDMCAPYREAVLDTLPKARIVVDRFHVVKSLNDKTATVASRIYHKEKEKLAALIREDKENGSNDISVNSLTRLIKIGGPQAANAERLKLLIECYSNSYFKNSKDRMDTNTEIKLTSLFREFSEFRELYLLKEGMRETFFDFPSKDEARKYADMQEAKIQGKPEYAALKVFFKTLNHSDWTRYIYSYFDDPIGDRYSNAIAESINSSLKDINRISRGLSSEVFQDKVLHGRRSALPVSKQEAKAAEETFKTMCSYEHMGEGLSNLTAHECLYIGRCLEVKNPILTELIFKNTVTPEEYQAVFQSNFKMIWEYSCGGRTMAEEDFLPYVPQKDGSPVMVTDPLSFSEITDWNAFLLNLREDVAFLFGKEILPPCTLQIGKAKEEIK